MHRIILKSVRGLLVALVALAATGDASYAHATRPDITPPLAGDAFLPDAVAQEGAAERLERRVERPLPFLAGSGAVESLLEINPRVNVRPGGRTADLDLDDGAHSRPATLTRLRVHLATRRHAAIVRRLAFASHGTLHTFSTPPPVPLP